MSYSRELPLLPAILDDNVAIGFRYGGGMTLAMLKPYYLKLIYTNNSTNSATATLHEESYSHNNAEHFLNPSLILGRAGWIKGLDQIKYAPGFHANCAIVIKPKGKKACTQSITLGGQILFAEGNTLPILANNDAFKFNICLWAGLELGRQWFEYPKYIFNIIEIDKIKNI